MIEGGSRLSFYCIPAISGCAMTILIALRTQLFIRRLGPEIGKATKVGRPKSTQSPKEMILLNDRGYDRWRGIPRAHYVFLLLVVISLSNGNPVFAQIAGAPEQQVTTIPVGTSPVAVAADPITNKVYVANFVSNTVTVIDGKTNQMISNIPVGKSPNWVAINSRMGKVYVVNSVSDTVSVINETTDKVIKTIPVGRNPVGVALNLGNGRLYVVNAGSKSVSVIDGSFDGIVSSISVGASPLGVAVNPRTSRVYVVNSQSNAVSVIDGETHALVATIEVGSYPNWVAVNPNTNKVYVSNGESSTISIINGTSNKLISTLAVGTDPIGIEIDIARNRLYVANSGSASFSIIDGGTDKLVSTVAVGSGPSGIAFNAITRKIYVANALSNTISVISEIPFEFAFSLSPSSATAEVGKATTFTLTITPTSGSPRAVNLSVAGLPQGASAIFAPRSGDPPLTSMLTITTSALTPPGTYSITVNAVTESTTKTSSITLTILAIDNTPMDFSLSSNPLTISILQREQATYTISLSLLRGKAEPVALSVIGLPADSTAEFSPATVSLTSTTQLKVVTQSTTPAGVYQISVVGHTQGGTTRSTTIFLTVRAPAPAPPEVSRQPFDFSISIVPTETRLDVGATVVVAINITLLSGTPDLVNLNIAPSYPSGVTFGFTPQKGVPSFVSIMKITTTSATTTGSYRMTITAANSVITRSSSFGLNITKQEPREIVREVVKEVPADAIREAVRGVLQESQKPPSTEDTVPVSLVLAGAGITALAVSVIVAAWVFTLRRKRPTEITV